MGEDKCTHVTLLELTTFSEYRSNSKESRGRFAEGPIKRQGNALSFGFYWGIAFMYPGLRKGALWCSTKTRFELRFVPQIDTSFRTVERIARPIVTCGPQSATRRNFEPTEKRLSLHLGSHTNGLYHCNATFSYPVKFRAVSGSEHLTDIVLPI